MAPEPNVRMLKSKISNSIDHIPPREADRRSASQDIPRLLLNPKFHFRVSKRSPV
jgi:hypothetical protein